MFRKIVNRFVPSALVSQRYKTEEMVKRFIGRETGKSIEEWYRLGNMGEREIKTFFDVVDEKFGADISSTDIEHVMVPAVKAGIYSLVEFAGRRALARPRGELTEDERDFVEALMTTDR
jgi:hypothetical protein